MRCTSLSEEYVLRAFPREGKYILYNYRRDKEYLTDVNTFQLLSLCDGTHSLEDILNSCENPTLGRKYLEYFLSKKIIKFHDFPFEINVRQKPKYYNGNANCLKHVAWYVTGRCNLECLHCFLGGSKYRKVELPFSEMRKILRSISETNVLAIGITGGEPFMRSDILKILEEIANYCINIRSIFTNGLLINEEIVKNLRKLDQKITFCVSLDGVGRSHDILRGMEGSFQKTIKNIKLLIKNDFPIAINTCITALNKEQMVELYHIIKSLNVERWRVAAPFDVGSWRIADPKLKVSIEDEIEVCMKIFDVWKKDGEPFILQLDHIFHSENRREEWSIDDYVCNYDRETCAILPNGDVIPCDALFGAGVIVGNILNKPLNELWESKEMRKFKDLKVKDLLLEECNATCNNCNLLKYCGLGCRLNAYIKTGNIYHYDPCICEIVKKFQNFITSF